MEILIDFSQSLFNAQVISIYNKLKFKEINEWSKLVNLINFSKILHCRNIPLKTKDKTIIPSTDQLI